MEDPILQPLSVEAVVVEPRMEGHGGDGGADLQVIRDVLSVHHVPVVASLHWDKLHSILHSLCDSLASQAVRLEKAEEQGKTFLSFKDDLDVLCKNSVKEMKEARESELEQQQNWSKMVEERLQSLQQRMDANNNDIKQLQTLDTAVQSFAPRLDALEAATNRLDAVEAVTKELEAFHATQPISLESLNTKLDELLVDFEEQNEKLHTLEEQNDQLKLRLEQTIKSHSSDLEALQQYCRNLRSDFELKFLVDVGKMPNAVEGEFSPASKSKLEAAVAELQNRIQKKADADEINKISQSTQNVKDAFEKMESNVVELRSQMKRIYAPRRSTRMSMNVGFVSQDNQMFVSEAKPTTIEELSPRLAEELTKDVRSSIENHSKELAKVQKDFGLLGRSILIMSGHQSQQLSRPGAFDSSERSLTLPENTGEISSKSLLDTNTSVDQQLSKSLAVPDSDGLSPEVTKRPFGHTLSGIPMQRHTLVRFVEQMDDSSVVRAIDEALKTNKFEPKESVKTISKMSEDISNITTRIRDLDTALPLLKDGLAFKADKVDLQRLARYVKEQLERPENAIFTTKPLYGYKCISCDHSVEKLSPLAGDHVPTNRMPPQILPMLSAERIFAFDRRRSSPFAGQTTGTRAQRVMSMRKPSSRKSPL